MKRFAGSFPPHIYPLHLMGKLGKKRKRAEPQDIAVDEDVPPITVEGATALLAALTCTGLSLYKSAPFRPLRTALYPLLKSELDSGVYFEPPLHTGPHLDKDEAGAGAERPLTLAACAPLLRVEEWRGLVLENSALRRALYPLVLELGEREGKRGEANLSSKVSTALHQHDWPTVLPLLHQLRGNPSEVKLGSLQRWVSHCCSLGATDELEGGTGSGSGSGGGGGRYPLLVLDSLLRLGFGIPPPTPSSSASHAAASAATVTALSQPSVTATIVRHPLWHPDLPAPPPPPPPSPLASSTAVTSLGGGPLHSRIVHTIPAQSRRPPAPTDLHVYYVTQGGVSLQQHPTLTPPEPLEMAEVPLVPSPSSPSSYAVPNVPGATLYPGLLSVDECGGLIAQLETLGYREDAVPGVECVHLLAHEEHLVTPLLHRLLAAHLPQTLRDGATCVGINARWRCFRYSPQATYRAHIDGAWPGSGLITAAAAAGGGGSGSGSGGSGGGGGGGEEKEYREDVYGGGVTSRLTLLLYLNGGFGGGGTTFFLPRPGTEGVIDAFGVEPRVGAALTFPHGDAVGSLVHEGSAVAPGGVKYIIRSDVLYSQCGSLAVRQGQLVEGRGLTVIN